MAGANYEYCPLCDTKALYVGEGDIPDEVVVMHKKCFSKHVQHVMEIADLNGRIFSAEMAVEFPKSVEDQTNIAMKLRSQLDELQEVNDH